MANQQPDNYTLFCIAMAELQLAEDMNNAAIQLQNVLGTGPDGPSPDRTVSLNQLLQANDELEEVLKCAIRKELILLSKLCPENNEENDVRLVDVGPNVNNQFDELNVSERTPVFELKSVYGLSDLRDFVITEGSGTVTNNAVEFILSTTNAGDRAWLGSVEKGRYMPGYAAQAGIATRIPTMPVGEQVIRWGYFNETNGYFFGGSGAEGIFVAIRRAGVDTIITQPNWNIDPLDGTGPSGLTLNLAAGNVYQIVFTWYGYGVIEFQVVVQDPLTRAQKVVTVHRVKNVGQTSVADPNLPVTGEVENNGTAGNLTLFVSGRQFSILGKFRPLFRSTSDGRTATVGTTLFPLISFRRKVEFPPGSNRPNSVAIEIEGTDVLAGANVFVQVLLGGTLSGGVGFVNFPTANTNIPNDETALQVNNSATEISGGQVLFQSLVPGGQGASSGVAEQDLIIELPRDGIITLAARTVSGSTTVTGVLRMREEW